MFFRSLVTGLALSAVLSACSGGGSAGSSLPKPPPSGPGTTPQSVTLSIRIPGPSTAGSAIRRTPRYVSSNTQSAVIVINSLAPVVINLASNSLNCVAAPGGGRTCTATVSAPAGTDTFHETMYASTDGTGAVLSQSTTSAVITPGVANTVTMTLDGVVATLGLSLATPNPPTGQKAQIVLTVTFKDASGAAIIGSAPFANPITLTDSDNSGITSLNRTSLTSPADAANLYVTYTGAPLQSATFTGTAAGATSGSATLTPQNVGPVVFNDYTTFGYDNQHEVFNPNSVPITPTSVNTGVLHLAWNITVNNGGGDFNIQSQPVLATEIPNHKGVLYVAGGSGNVYGYDALNGSAVWSQPAFTGQETYACDPNNPNIVSYFGAGGSVAYDPGSRSLFVVGNSNPKTNAFGVNELFHLDGATGSQIGSPVNFGAGQVGANELNFSHTSVTLSNGIAYVGTGATCDIPSWRGRIAAIDTRTNNLTTFYTVWDPNNSRGQGAQPWGGGGIWGWGGVSADFSGNIVTGVGNTDDGSSFNGKIQPPFVAAPHEWSGLGESVMQISPDLSTVLASNHPIPQTVYGGQSVDLDVQGTPEIFQPLGAGCGPMAALQSKSGALLLYNETAINSGAASFQLAPSTAADGFLGGPSFSPNTNLVYAPIAATVSPLLLSPGLIAIKPCPGLGQAPQVIWHTAFGPDSTPIGFARSVPAVSAGGVVFIATSCDKMSGLCPTYGQYSALWALDASSGAILNGSAPILYTPTPIRAPVTIDGNWAYVIDQGGDMYGFTVDPNYAKIAAKRRTTSARMFHYPGRATP